MQGHNDKHPQLWNAGPVRIITRSHKGTYSPPPKCRYPDCTRPVRRAQGAKYCDEHAVSVDYQLQQSNGLGRAVAQTCTCGRTFVVRKKVQSPAAAAWAEFCPDCHNETPLTLDQLRSHHVSTDVARTWLAQTSQLKCDICGKRLTRRHRGAWPIIDHQHTCCPGGSSCGKCVRGVLCQDCNTKVGHVEGIALNGLLAAVERYLARL
jgi:hypothetical protein